MARLILEDSILSFSENIIPALILSNYAKIRSYLFQNNQAMPKTRECKIQVIAHTVVNGNTL